MRGRAWHAALQWELSVRSWDESATQRRKRRGEKTHIHLDRTKKYKCARIRPWGIASFACFKNKGSLLNCGGFVQPCLTSWFLLLLKTDSLYERKQCRRWMCAWHLKAYWETSAKANTPQKWCVSMLCIVRLLHKLTHVSLTLTTVTLAPTPHPQLHLPPPFICTFIPSQPVKTNSLRDSSSGALIQPHLQTWTYFNGTLCNVETAIECSAFQHSA